METWRFKTADAPMFRHFEEQGFAVIEEVLDGPWTVKDGVLNVQPPMAVLSGIMTIRLHLDVCGEDDGALQVLPGSHQAGRLDATRISAWRERVAPVVCSVGRGGAVLMRPLILHASAKARAPRHRRVVHLEFSANALAGGLAWAV